MNLQIHFYKDIDQKVIPAKAGKVRQKGFVFTNSSINRKIIGNYVNDRFDNDDDRLDFIKLAQQPREYMDILGISVDSHFEYEMLGLSLTKLNFPYTISLENHLDLVLNFLCNSSIDKVRNMNNYEKISKAIMTLDLDNLDIKFEEFFNIDDNLNKYMEGLLSLNKNELDTVKMFFCNILGTADNILKGIGFFLQGKGKVKVLSFSYGKIIIGCKEQFKETLEIYKDEEKLIDLIPVNYRLKYL